MSRPAQVSLMERRRRYDDERPYEFRRGRSRGYRRDASPPPVESTEDEVARIREISEGAGGPTYVRIGSEGTPTMNVY